MTPASRAPQGRERGTIDELPSGALRVRVSAGTDPVSKRRHYLTEIVPAGPKALARARSTRDRLVREVEERRHPRTAATVTQLLDRYLDQFDGSARTAELYAGYVRKHIVPLLGAVKVAALDPEILDSFYAELRRCRDHCTGRPKLQHRTDREHECDHRCGAHVCKPLGPTTVRHLHFILSGAFKSAVRWRWVATNPCAQAQPPAAPTPNPRPPSSTEAARIVSAAWRDPDWGALIWLAMTTGARRGELCGLRWRHVDLGVDRAVLWLQRAIGHTEQGWVEGDLKNHQQRRIALDAATVAVLIEHQQRYDERVRALGAVPTGDAFVFSSAPNASSFLAPSSVTQRYDRLVSKIGVDTTFHKLRHYSATELIAAGVDVRTVAGRLGHSGGGTTTLKAYAAWVSEADQRAAEGIGAAMPDRPAPRTGAEETEAHGSNPYERIAVQLRRQVLDGERAAGEPAPSLKELAAEHGVSLSTASRAMQLLDSWGLVTSAHGQRATIAAPPVAAGASSDDLAPADHHSPTTSTRRRMLDLAVTRSGIVVSEVTAEADPNDGGELRQLLLDAVQRQGDDVGHVGLYTMAVREHEGLEVIKTVVTSARS